MENLTPLTRNEPNLDKFLELNIDNANIKLYFNTTSILFKITNNTIPKKDYESYLSLEQLIKINKFFANFETPKELVEWVINSLNKKNSNIQINEDKAILKILNPINNKTYDLILNLKKKDINARVTYLEEIIEQQNKKIELLEQRVKNLELLIKENVDEKKFFNESNILNKKEKKLLIEWLPKKPNKIFLLLNSIHDGDSTQVFKNKCSNKCPTLAIIETTKGFKFGGYTSEYWKEGAVRDDKAFVFSLDKKKKYEILNPEYATGFGSGSWWGFGYNNNAIVIFDKCTSNKRNYVENKTYNIKEEYELNNGEHFFTVKSFEIYYIDY